MSSLIHCLDACEQLNAGNIEHVLQRMSSLPALNRIYIGSSFCCRYLFQAANDVFEPMLDFCAEHALPVTLVLPIASQRFEAELDCLLADFTRAWPETIDELTCNDYALLAHCVSAFPQKANIGRLLSKDLREPREPYFSQIVSEPSILTRDLALFAPLGRIASIELDPTHRVQDVVALPQGVEAALRLDWCYITTGKICEEAGINKPTRGKFRPSERCEGECQRAAIHYCGDTSYSYWKHGATSYFYQPDALLIGAERYRVLANPLLTELFAPQMNAWATFRDPHADGSGRAQPSPPVLPLSGGAAERSEAERVTTGELRVAEVTPSVSASAPTAPPLRGSSKTIEATHHSRGSSKAGEGVAS